MAELKPFGWVFSPKMKGITRIEVEKKPVVFCSDCKYGALMNDATTYMCESPEQENRICVHEHDGNWFCADGESRDENG